MSARVKGAYLPPDTLVHRLHCTAPKVSKSRGRYGDLMARCHNCGAATVLEVLNSAPKLAEPEGPRYGYRCREHLGEPVDWRGKGCQRCKREAERRGRRRESTSEDPWGSDATPGQATATAGLGPFTYTDPNRSTLWGSR